MLEKEDRRRVPRAAPDPGIPGGVEPSDDEIKGIPTGVQALGSVIPDWTTVATRKTDPGCDGQDGACFDTIGFSAVEAGIARMNAAFQECHPLPRSGSSNRFSRPSGRSVPR